MEAEGFHPKGARKEALMVPKRAAGREAKVRR